MTERERIPPTLTRYDSVSHYALGLLNDALSRSTKSNAEVTPLAAGAGLVSEVFCIQLKNRGYESSMVAKIPNLDYVHGEWSNAKGTILNGSEKEQKAPVEKTEKIVQDLHNREVLFYRHATLNIRELKYPTLFHGDFIGDDQDGVLLMEDFSKQLRPAATPLAAHTLSVKQVEQVIEELCKLQTATVGDADLKQTFPLLPSQLEVVAKAANASADVLDRRRLAWFTPRILRRIHKYAQPQSLEQLLAPTDGVNVLMHGDLQAKDILWGENKETNEPQLLAIIDWVAAAAGSPTTDLAVVIGTSMDATARQNAEALLVRRFVELWNQKAPDGKRLSLPEVELMYRESLKFAALKLLITVVTNPEADDPTDACSEGVLTERLRLLIDDVSL